VLAPCGREAGRGRLQYRFSAAFGGMPSDFCRPWFFLLTYFLSPDSSEKDPLMTGGGGVRVVLAGNKWRRHRRVVAKISLSRIPSRPKLGGPGAPPFIHQSAGTAKAGSGLWRAHSPKRAD